MAEAHNTGRPLSAGRIAVHLFANLFLALAAFSAVWQCGDPFLAHLIIGAAVFSTMSGFMFTGKTGITVRKVIQILILSLALGWTVYRASSRVTVDIFLIEFLCIAGVSFGLTLNMKDYGVQCLIGVILLICGSVFPRSAFIYALPFAFMAGMAFVYASRLVSLSGDHSIRFTLAPLWRNRNYFILHFLMAVALWFYFCTFFPSPSKTGFGMVTTSTLNYNVSFLPPKYEEWFRSDYKKASETGNAMTDSNLKPPSPGKGESVSRDIENTEDSVDGDGSGAPPPGNDLVFRVKSPVKTYWLAALYDGYDGRKWAATKEMKTQKVKHDPFEFSGSSFPQNFVVSKYQSPTLCSAFVPRYFSMTPGSRIRLESTFYNSRITDPEAVTAPFSYDVNSVIFTSENTYPDFKPSQLWFERLQQKHYTALPKKEISERLRRLSAVITADEGDVYRKAVFLRDYLRNNFKYRLDAEKTPEDRETTDYFIFDIKEGNCQYFASSLTVLARLNGIPARLATGYSPGNYNTLNGTFEVYEYHAHAWTQLFIEGKGWLTFDATPPGEVVSRTTPLIIGSLEDPFGDEWKVTPPELTRSTREFFAAREKSRHEKQADSNSPNVIQKIAVNIPTSQSELKRTINVLTGENQKNVTGEENSKIKKLGKFFNGVKNNAIAMWDHFIAGLKSFAYMFFSFRGLSFQLAVLVLFLFFRFGLRAVNFLRRRRRLRRCLGMIDGIRDRKPSDPGERISLCYRLTREILELAGLKRERNMELFNYGLTIKMVDYNLSKDVLAVFFMYTKTHYSPFPPAAEDADVSQERLLRIRDNIVGNLRLV